MAFFKKINLINYIENPSVVFILFPYFIFLFLNSKLSFELIFVVAFFVFIDIFFLNKIKIKNWLVLIISSLIIFFYSKIFFKDTEIILHQLRFREFILLFSSLALFFIYIIFKIDKGPKLVNIFFLVFGITFLFNTNSNKFYNREIILAENNFKFDHNKAVQKKSESPVILIIFDELSSSKEIYKYTNDSIDLSFDVALKKKGFVVLDNFISESIHTKFSMPSIFNFNLHANSSILDSIDRINDKVTIQKSYYWIASNNLLVDSLNDKAVKSNSYGLFPFSNGVFNDNFNYWWPSFSDPLRMFGNNNFFQEFFQETILKSIESVFLDKTSVEKFKEDVFTEFKYFKPKKNNFYYFHFYAPHEPYKWGKEYDSKLKSNTQSVYDDLEEHIKFRRFFLNKILPHILDEKLTDTRIIISGDHGYRGSINKINPKNTNLYTYGFDLDEIKNINSVQDLGYLIYESFSNK